MSTARGSPNWYIPLGSLEPVVIGAPVREIEPTGDTDERGRPVVAIRTFDGERLLTAEPITLLRRRTQNLEPRMDEELQRKLFPGVRVFDW